MVVLISTKQVLLLGAGQHDTKSTVFWLRIKSRLERLGSTLREEQREPKWAEGTRACLAGWPPSKVSLPFEGT